MILRELFPDAAFEERHAERAIAGVAVDSRKVKAGDAFVAVPGTKADGLSFVPAALAAGAVAIVAEKPPLSPLPDGVAFVRVDDARRALALAAAKVHPRQPSVIAAVTGTSGKTSVTVFARQIWTSLGFKAASIGTIGVVSPRGEDYGALTTPDPIELHRTLDRLAGEGVSHLAIEASSHGLDQRRLDGLRIAAAAFTNISRDHLDYHGTAEAYLAAKLRLFSTLMAPGSAAVVDVDHDGAADVLSAVKVRKLDVLTIGRNGDGIRLIDAKIDGLAQIIEVAHRGQRHRVRLSLVGEFQVENALVAAGFAIATGADAAAAFAAVEHLAGAKGRLELVGQKNNAPIFVDYAHKPDALAKALEALRPYAKRRLVVVFGCGGDRDRGKRPIMGAIAVAKADRVIVTDDNPRSEVPARIRAEILAGAVGATEIGDRGEAIRRAVAALEPGDALLIAGKGHESGQIIGDRVLPFTDHAAVAAALEERVA
ncbi:MAG TPA: UDP-N-acetylmuramoyl-L-alanyl-D-glutamate--2,6-diaminopimelate ligase [Xanthobacteraceae bacterium]|jgi:UDP-N-acetylmuramoyl-L-alanyl-D-glutamate--2,6-diaminopimelate ligase|nr:UDP-N-acetylmuramoyl-L-alanyl-D-glutamate--2,6-diaminopimelate ligase [Xanthobacteraceae bacterium]